MIVAVVSLIVALSGTAFAAKKLGLSSLTGNAKNQTVGAGPLTYVSLTSVIPPTSSNGLDVAAACPPGTFVIGGGIKVSNDPAEIVNDSAPSGTSWAGTVINAGSISHTATVTAICATSRVVQ